MIQFVLSLTSVVVVAGNSLAFLPASDNNLPAECENYRENKSYLRKIPKCRVKSLSPGDLCRGGGSKDFGTSRKLNNCGNFDIYEASACSAKRVPLFDLPGQCEQPQKRKNKRWLRRLDPCHLVKPGKLCRGEDGHCDTDRRLNNCGNFDIYRRAQAQESFSTPPPESPSTLTISPAPLNSIDPEYSQNCMDDAGPVWEDEEEIYGKGKRYHTKSKAVAILKDGQCADPVKASCDFRAKNGQLTALDARGAYLEGPLQCNGKGWFCRILPDREHKGGVLKGDFNFNHCNETEYGDTSGHCHGSDDDDVYYWWVRDHWHRNYAGRLHCCCDWNAVTGVVSRCDYRAPVPKGEHHKCRDANEDHTGPGSGFSKGFEDGCPNLGTRDPLPEPDDSQCWDVSFFAPGGRD